MASPKACQEVRWGLRGGLWVPSLMVMLLRGHPSRFWVTPIDAMEAAIHHQTFGDMLAAEPAPAAPGGITSVYTPVKTPLMITGIQPHRLEQLSSRLEVPTSTFSN